MSSEIVVDDTDHRSGFTLMNNWRFVADHYFNSREEAEKFIAAIQKSIEKVWPIDGY